VEAGHQFVSIRREIMSEGYPPRIRRLVGAVAPQPDPLAAVAASAARGEPAAERTLLSTIGPHLLRIVRRVLGSNHLDVEDVFQDCAVAVMSALPRYRGESTVLHFACRVAFLTAANVRRKHATDKRRAEREYATLVEALPIASPGPHATASSRATAELVRELLDSLPLEQSEVLGLHCVLGYTVPEIARSAGLPVETVRSRLRLAKRALRLRVLGDARFDERSKESS
jgi:RNA polymerase sigma-70 factor (ECF subfamily)